MERILTEKSPGLVKVLLVGGSGHVGTLVTPYLQQVHELRVLDLAPPSRDVDFVEGSIADPEALARALDGMDTFITVVMKGGQGGFTRDHTPQLAIDNYTVNCLGLHLLLLTAHDLGIHCGIHTGTMSQHHRGRDWYPGPGEDHVPLCRRPQRVRPHQERPARGPGRDLARASAATSPASSK